VRNGKFMENYNPYRVIVHLHVFIDVAFRPEDRELTIETWTIWTHPSGNGSGMFVARGNKIKLVRI
jgi:hypothetical protein